MASNSQTLQRSLPNATIAAGTSQQPAVPAVASNNNWIEGFVTEQIDPNDKDFKWLISKVKKSGDLFTVHKAYRIKNSATWASYVETRKKIYEEMGSSERVLEKRLFHGSPFSLKIAEEGFKLSYARNGSCGVGVYFSNLSSESYSFSMKNGAQTSYHMLICRVALGKMSSGTTALTPGYHSVNYGSKFVVYDEKQAYPSFLIEIKPKS
ncbi:uncharacterized protein LOC132199524 [Neocloeon triangulifer]|uniref:uncharacterized protein LOC132199524 n=1 Tax=Neocloeon triangulifer TaxID=2078957 RepID=UPI00286F702C|nr:uncharacterized protein LOC132199524 [Neocloeon triangulifer]